MKKKSICIVVDKQSDHVSVESRCPEAQGSVGVVCEEEKVQGDAICPAQDSGKETKAKESHSRINVVDSIMGSGKSTWAIGYMNRETDRPFLYVTPYLEEDERIIEACPNRYFVQPKERPTKGADLIRLLEEGKNIATTHRLFREVKMTGKLKETIQEKGYILILDEVLEVVEAVDISQDDKQMLLNEFITVDDQTGIVEWPGEYTGKFESLKHMINSGNIIMHNQALLWRLPIETLAAFEEMYILTFMFEGSPMDQYLKIHKMQATYHHISDGDLKPGKQDLREKKKQLASLIHICEIERLNELGKIKKSIIVPDKKESAHRSYSRAWWQEEKKKKTTQSRKKTISLAKKAELLAYSFLHNYCGATAETTMWSNFIDENSKKKGETPKLAGKYYGTSFCPCNARATNVYQNKYHLAYLINVYCNPIIQGWFRENGGEIDEERYALSQLLQWIWRSRIRKGEPIELYLPSERMRKLLQDWLLDSAE